MKKIPIGISDFKELIEENYVFADKTLLIKALLDDGAKVTLFTRPRRFGKTLNLSMISYFFSNTKKIHCHCFMALISKNVALIICVIKGNIRLFF